MHNSPLKLRQRSVGICYLVVLVVLSLVIPYLQGATSCFSADENDSLVLSCADLGVVGGVITKITFASFGSVSPKGNECTETGGCHAVGSLVTVQGDCLGNPSCSVAASRNHFSYSRTCGEDLFLKVAFECTGCDVGMGFQPLRLGGCVADPCLSMPCGNGGVCSHDGFGAFACACTTGFLGATCSIDQDLCAGNPCENGAACFDAGTHFQCMCSGNFGGQKCDLCRPGWQGAGCTTPADDCGSNEDHCNDNSLSLSLSAGCVPRVAPMSGHTCSCLGTAQEVDGVCEDINYCSNGGDTCALAGDAGAVCVDGDFGRTCACSGGYTASGSGVCVETHACTGAGECQGSGDSTAVCVDLPPPSDAYSCVCNAGYTFDNSTGECEDHDDCGARMGRLHMCKLGGDGSATCVDDGPPSMGHSCNCAQAYIDIQGVCHKKKEHRACSTRFRRTNSLHSMLAYDIFVDIDALVNPDNAIRETDFAHAGVISRYSMFTSNHDRWADLLNYYRDTGSISCSMPAVLRYNQTKMSTYTAKDFDFNAHCISPPYGLAYSCECGPGYEPVGDPYAQPMSDVSCIDIDECGGALDLCADIDAGASCVDNDAPLSGHYCVCSDGYEDVDGICVNKLPCGVGNQRCKHGGVCKLNKTSEYPLNDYYCDCVPPYAGEHCWEWDACQQDIPPCERGVCTDVLATCMNTYGMSGVAIASCMGAQTQYMCNCTGTGYMGDECQTVIDPCNPNPCNSRPCVVDGADAECICGNAYYGDNCESAYSDWCDDHSPCANGAACQSRAQAPYFECDCGDTGYDGNDCTRDFNDCKSSPCLNGGVCEDEGFLHYYNCSCPQYDKMSNYEGTECQLDINDPPEWVEGAEVVYKENDVTKFSLLEIFWDDDFGQLCGGNESRTDSDCAHTILRLDENKHLSKTSSLYCDDGKGKRVFPGYLFRRHAYDDLLGNKDAPVCNSFDVYLESSAFAGLLDAPREWLVITVMDTIGHNITGELDFRYEVRDLKPTINVPTIGINGNQYSFTVKVEDVDSPRVAIRIKHDIDSLKMSLQWSYLDTQPEPFLNYSVHVVHIDPKNLTQTLTFDFENLGLGGVQGLGIAQFEVTSIPAHVSKKEAEDEKVLHALFRTQDVDTVDTVLNIQCPTGLSRNAWSEGDFCVPCPLGAQCIAAHDFIPVNQEGWWRFDSGDESEFLFLKCNPATACPAYASDELERGNSDGICYPGYEGSMCGTCAPGYFRSQSNCKACLNNDVLKWMIVGMGLSVAILALLWLSSRGTFIFKMTGVTFAFFQTLNELNEIDLAWTPAMLRMFNITSVFHFNIELVSPECSMPKDSTPEQRYSIKFIGTMIVPLVIVAGLLTAFVLYILFIFARELIKGKLMQTVDGEQVQVTKRLKFLNFRDTLVRAGTMFLAFAYLPLLSQIVSLYGCTKQPSGFYSFDAQQALACYDPWWYDLLVYDIIGIFVYVLGIPGYFAWALRRRPRLAPDVHEEADSWLIRKLFAGPTYTVLRLEEYSVALKKWGKSYQPLTLQYAGHAFYWTCVIFCREGINSVVRTFTPLYPVFQGAFVIMLLFMYGLLQRDYLPFAIHTVNLLEFAGLMTNGFVVIIGILLSGENLNDTERDVAGGFAVTSVLLMCCFVMVVLVRLVFTHRKYGGTNEVMFPNDPISENLVTQLMHPNNRNKTKVQEVLMRYVVSHELACVEVQGQTADPRDYGVIDDTLQPRHKLKAVFTQDEEIIKRVKAQLAAYKAKKVERQTLMAAKSKKKKKKSSRPKKKKAAGSAYASAMAVKKAANKLKLRAKGKKKTNKDEGVERKKKKSDKKASEKKSVKSTLRTGMLAKKAAMKKKRRRRVASSDSESDE
jgi:hypothetical protein